MPALGGSGYHHTLTNIRDHVRANLGELSTNSFWSDTVHLDKYVNEALYDMALSGIVAEKTYSADISSGDQTYIPQSDVWKISRIDLGDRRLREIFEPDMDAVTGEDWNSGTGRPSRWFDDGTYVRFDTVLDADETVNVFYWAVPVELASGTDGLSLDRVMLPLVVNYACAKACLMERDTERFQQYMAMYQNALEKAKFHVMSPNASDPPICRDTIGW